MFVLGPVGPGNLAFPKTLAELDPCRHEGTDVGRSAVERFSLFLRSPEAARWSVPVGIVDRLPLPVPVPTRVLNCVQSLRPDVPDSMSVTDLLSLRAFGAKSLMALIQATEDAGFPPTRVQPHAPLELKGLMAGIEPDQFPRLGQRVLPSALLPFLPDSEGTVDMLAPEALDRKFWSGPNRHDVQHARRCARRYLERLLNARLRGVLDLCVPVESIRSAVEGVTWSSATLRLLQHLVESGAMVGSVRVRDLVAVPGSSVGITLDFIAGAEESGILRHAGRYDYPVPGSVMAPEDGRDASTPAAASGHLDDAVRDTMLRDLLEIRDVRRNDPRFGEILDSFRSPAASFGDVLDDPVAFRTRNPAQFDVSLSCAHRALVRAKGLSLDEEIGELLERFGLGAEQLEIGAAIFRAGPARTQAEIADGRDVHRLRILRVVHSLDERLKQAFMPVLNSLRDRKPVLASAPADQPIADGPAIGYPPEKLHGLLSRFGDRPTRLVSALGVVLVVHEDEADAVQAAIFEFLRRVKHWCGGRRDRLLPSGGPAWADEVIKDVLARSPQIEWVDRANGVFTLDPETTANRIVTPICRIVAVAGEIDVKALRHALLRHYRYRGMPFSSVNLLELCRRIPGITVDGTMLRNRSLHIASLLGAVDSHVWKLLNSQRTPLSRTEMQDGLRETGISPNTVAAAMAYSIIVHRTADRRFTLVGKTDDSGSLGQARLWQPGREAALLGKGRLADGRIWMTYRVSGSMLESDSFSVPSAFSEEVRGQVVLRSLEGSEQFWGQSNGLFARFGDGFMERARIEQGDGVLVVIDPSSGEGVFVVGDATDLNDRTEDGDWDSLLGVPEQDHDQDVDGPIHREDLAGSMPGRSG